jgi:hypothetical protein
MIATGSPRRAQAVRRDRRSRHGGGVLRRARGARCRVGMGRRARSGAASHGPCRSRDSRWLVPIPSRGVDPESDRVAVACGRVDVDHQARHPGAHPSSPQCAGAGQGSGDTRSPVPRPRSAGVGLGWCQEEADMVGYNFADRTSRADDTIRAMRALWSENETYNDRWWSFEHACSNPKPFGEHGVPVIVGGTSPATARRAGRLGDGFFPSAWTAAELRPLVATVRAAAMAGGRDPDRIELTCPLRLGPDERSSLRSAIDELTEAPVTRLVVGCPTCAISPRCGPASSRWRTARPEQSCRVLT